MAGEAPLPVHTSNTFEDLSGISTKDFSNPYDALIAACNDEPSKIQERYALHRNTRNAQQKAKLLDEHFPGVTIDPILLRLWEPHVEPGYQDPRHCLVFWARPTQKIKEIIRTVQEELLAVAPHMWLMPQDCLHMTVLEITHSRTAAEIQALVEAMKDKIPSITDYTFEHRARLIKPMIGFDASALALSFVPAAGEDLGSSRTIEDEQFTYHHLRRDVYQLCSATGVQVDSRYVVPSSHLTIGRFIKSTDFSDESGAPSPTKMRAFVQKIEEINARLQAEFWPESNNGKIPSGGEWLVGEEKGLNCRMGTLWYGGGESVNLGKGF